MRKEYDFSHGRSNPYAKRLKRSVTIRLDETTIAHFKDLAAETGIAYQTLNQLVPTRVCRVETSSNDAMNRAQEGRGLTIGLDATVRDPDARARLCGVERRPPSPSSRRCARVR